MTFREFYQLILFYFLLNILIKILHLKIYNSLKINIFKNNIEYISIHIQLFYYRINKLIMTVLD